MNQQSDKTQTFAFDVFTGAPFVSMIGDLTIDAILYAVIIPQYLFGNSRPPILCSPVEV